MANPATPATAQPASGGLSQKAADMIAGYQNDIEDGDIDAVESVDATVDGEDAVEQTFDGSADAQEDGTVRAESIADAEPAAPAKDAAKSNETKPDEAKSSDIVEEYEIEGTDGMGRKVSVTFDAKTRKRLVHAAAQRHRFQSERDRAMASLKDAQPKLTAYESLNKAWTSSADPVDRVRSLISNLSGGPEAFEAAVQKEIQHRDWLAKASPTERAAWERETAQKRAEAALAAERQKLADERAAHTAKAEADLQARNEAAVHGEFEKQRFSGRIKDEVLADRLDRQVFAAAVGTVEDAIREAKEAGTPLDAAAVAALARSAFREHFAALKNLVKSQAKTEAAAAVDAAKMNAANKASAIAAGESRGSASPKGAQAKGGRAGMAAAILASMRASR